MSDSFREELAGALGPSYTIERELAGGGMSRVFIATEHGLNRTVVVKVLKPDLAADVNRERFRREIMLAAQLQHPHIVPVLNAGEHKDLLWYTMPFVEGESLREEIRRAHKPMAKEVMRVLHDVLDALAYAHARGVIHRDIKPGNILRHGMHSLVTDFGVAKAISASLPHSGSTTAGTAIGTPAYMAPEQLAADPKADHRLDLYAVGLLAYEFLTGTQPFAESSPQATLAAQLTRMPKPLSEVRPDLPLPLSALITRLLAKNPDDRPASAAAALHELEQLSTPAETPAPTWVPGAHATRPSRRRGGLLAAGGAVALLALVAVLLKLRDGKPARTSTTSAVLGSTTKVAPPTAITGATTRVLGSASPGGGTKAAAIASAIASKQLATADSASVAAKRASVPQRSPVGKAPTPPRPASTQPALPPPRRFATPRRVAVLPPKYPSSSTNLAPTAQALLDSLRRTIAAGGYTLATDAELVQLLSQAMTMPQRSVAEAMNLGAVVNLDLAVRGGELVAQSMVLDVWRNQHILERETADPDRPRDALEIVRDVARSLDRVSWRTRNDPKSVLVFDFDNQTGIDSMSPVARALTDSLRVAIARRTGIASTGDSAARATRDVLERRVMGVRHGAGAIVAGSVLRVRADTVAVRVTVRDMSDERNFDTIELRLPRVLPLFDVVSVLMSRLEPQLAQINWGPRKGG